MMEELDNVMREVINLM